MTPPAFNPPQEYIITADQIKTIMSITCNVRIGDILRSRPLPAFPAISCYCRDCKSAERTGNCEDWQKYLKDHDTAIREATINEMFQKSKLNALVEHDATIEAKARADVLDKIFPKAHSGESGWRYDLKFLSDLEFRTEERGEYTFQCEDIEEVLTVFEESLRIPQQNTYSKQQEQPE